MIMRIILSHKEWICSLEPIMFRIWIYTFRIFCHGTMNEEANKLGVRCIAYNKNSVVLARLSIRMERDSTLMLEILAIKKALELALQNGWRKVGFFSNSKIAIDSIRNPQHSFS